MTAKNIDPTERILSELVELSVLVARVEQGWTKASKSQDDFFLDSVALNLHGFYSGFERIFERISSLIDENIPEGANWHQELLNKMTLEIPGKRPAVISEDLKKNFEMYRGFRHVVRNVYTYHMKPEKIEPLVKKLPSVFTTAEKEIQAFVDFMKNRADETG
ncbi:hypothetical protein SAMN05660860_03269 [Geoalkalibacter ferrihydriticus]|uniref:HepT-like domain-containing protein n=2 Tax=Geoalkalibacter ferrihydriticus TaxID=392333 RepID=A0A0C2EA51_9BACT|nr:hypothetical protein [Geoalkalibacter ferrihydriticus]KIH75468.1 hypothetical protein GFER_16025 [Geoalkalibacter ferrihydriticus DSM 17813]SDM84921.1 hypothetical protein SAMN05660860_03269 [Geoalkalibacter ferrihydriticus]